MIEYPDLADQSTGEESTTSQQAQLTQDLLEETQTLLTSSEEEHVCWRSRPPHRHGANEASSARH